MTNWFGKGSMYFTVFMCRLREKAAGLYREENGDLVSSLGWMAIMALALVLIKTIVDGRLTAYATTIFNQLDRVFGP